MTAAAHRLRPIAVCLEAGQKRTFASVLDWPGWARAGRQEQDALAALAAYRDRYGAALALSGLDGPDGAPFRVSERVTGNATTDFGAPARPAPSELRPLGAAATAQLVARMQAAWVAFDSVVATAPAQLRKGPRGGGRDTAGIVAHFYGAEKAYAHKVGFRVGLPDPGDPAAVADWRQGLSAAVAAAVGVTAPATGWPGRYAARRIAWHALDHAWEIEDKRTPG